MTTNFDDEVAERVAAQGGNEALRDAAGAFMAASIPAQYSYNFSWLGRPIIQYPQDIVAMQELLWRVQPDLVIETGIAHGGSLLLSASMLELNAACGGPREARVVGIDIDIRAHNRAAIEAHPMHRRITMLEGSSTSPGVAEIVQRMASMTDRVMVCLDSNHTSDHVLAELEIYAPLVTVGSYCVVFDTIVDDLPAHMYPDRAWKPGNSPMTAVRTFLAGTSDFVVDTSIDEKLLISVARCGYLKRVS